jgi:hypothetical protein
MKKFKMHPGYVGTAYAWSWESIGELWDPSNRINANSDAEWQFQLYKESGFYEEELEAGEEWTLEDFEAYINSLKGVAAN